MTKVEKLEHEIRSLSAQELTRFREWFAAFDAAAWDRQIEEDARARDARANFESPCRTELLATLR
jgi:hypothetical protein